MCINMSKCQSQGKTKPHSGESLFRSLDRRWHLLGTNEECGAVYYYILRFFLYSLVSKDNTPDLPVQPPFSRVSFPNTTVAM